MDEFRTSRIVPTTDSTPASQVSFFTGWRRKIHAMNAAKNPLREGKKAVLVAVVNLSAIAMVISARNSQLPRNIPRLTTALLISFQEERMTQSATGTSEVISKNEKIMGSIRPNASLDTE